MRKCACAKRIFEISRGIFDVRFSFLKRDHQFFKFQKTPSLELWASSSEPRRTPKNYNFSKITIWASPHQTTVCLPKILIFGCRYKKIEQNTSNFENCEAHFGSSPEGVARRRRPKMDAIQFLSFSSTVFYFFLIFLFIYPFDFRSATPLLRFDKCNSIFKEGVHRNLKF